MSAWAAGPPKLVAGKADTQDWALGSTVKLVTTASSVPVEGQVRRAARAPLSPAEPPLCKQRHRVTYCALHHFAQVFAADKRSGVLVLKTGDDVVVVSTAAVKVSPHLPVCAALCTSADSSAHQEVVLRTAPPASYVAEVRGAFLPCFFPGASSPTPDTHQATPQLDDARIQRRLDDALRAAEAATQRLGVGVTRNVQALFDALAKTCVVPPPCVTWLLLSQCVWHLTRPVMCVQAPLPLGRHNDGGPRRHLHPAALHKLHRRLRPRLRARAPGPPERAGAPGHGGVSEQHCELHCHAGAPSTPSPLSSWLRCTAASTAAADSGACSAVARRSHWTRRGAASAAPGTVSWFHAVRKVNPDVERHVDADGSRARTAPEVVEAGV